ncbi:MAG: hypothetical protein M1829_000566 [Trizodia sp. TS-e1964]|nr:MAG: hypothetical protein M1829_000566 [Trizodia sp. TS-e1964]
MSGKKIVVVFGATGVQGGSVVKSILADPRTAQEWKIRGVTRDPQSSRAKALTAKGVECVEGDVNSKESLRGALKGAYAVFAVTNYWEKEDSELETRQGKALADVAHECGVQHYIWSTLVNVNELTKGKFSGVFHFDSKAEVEKYIRTSLPGLPTTYFMPGFYMSNITGGMMSRNPQSPSHEYCLFLPVPDNTPIPLFDAEDDTGKFVKAILTHRASTLNKNIHAATAYYSAAQVVEEFKEVKVEEAAKGAKFVQVPAEAFKDSLKQAGMSARAQEEMLQNMQFMTDYGYFGKASLDESLAILDEKPTTWKEYVARAPAWSALK